MKRFNFRLQKYLNLKKQQEEIQRSILSGAQAYYEAEKYKLVQIDQKIEELLAYGKTLRQVRLNIEMLLLAETYQITLSGQKKTQVMSVEDALVRLDAERKKYLDLQRNRKLLERLREKLWQKFYQDCLSDDQKILDEIGISSFGSSQLQGDLAHPFSDVGHGGF